MTKRESRWLASVQPMRVGIDPRHRE